MSHFTPYHRIFVNGEMVDVSEPTVRAWKGSVLERYAMEELALLPKGTTDCGHDQCSCLVPPPRELEMDLEKFAVVETEQL